MALDADTGKLRWYHQEVPDDLWDFDSAYECVLIDREVNGLMRKLLYYSDQNFLFWGADDTADVFCGYTVTLESGFPSDAIIVILRSIKNTDKFVGEMKPFIDGSIAS